MEEQKLYSKKEVLNIFKITRQTLNNWRRKGTIKYVRINDRKFLYELPETKIIQEGNESSKGL
jgi:predicted site-specific integrase-resolvase